MLRGKEKERNEDEWLVMVGGVGGVWLVEVSGMSHYFCLRIFSFMLQLLSKHSQHFFFLFFFLDENMIIIMTLLGKIFGKRK